MYAILCLHASCRSCHIIPKISGVANSCFIYADFPDIQRDYLVINTWSQVVCVMPLIFLSREHRRSDMGLGRFQLVKSVGPVKFFLNAKFGT